MHHWLVKSEPDAFSWEQQVANGTEPWTGVRNHAAKRNLMAMRLGDRAFFYHSNVGKEIVGVVEIVREAYPDPTAKEEGWVAVDMKAVAPWPCLAISGANTRRPLSWPISSARRGRPRRRAAGWAGTARPFKSTAAISAPT